MIFINFNLSLQPEAEEIWYIWPNENRNPYLLNEDESNGDLIN